MFSSALRVIAISSNTTVVFNISCNDTVLFSNIYTPDESNNVYVYNIDKIICDAITGTHASFVFSVGGVEKNVLVVRCNTLVDIPASEFIKKHFLTPLMSTRSTSFYRKECLSLIAETSTSVDALVTYFKNGELNTITKHLTDVTNFSTIDVSPSLFLDEHKGQLVHYCIKAGQRTQEYDVVPNNPDAISVIYRNSFHAFDTFHFNGLITTEFEHTRSNAVVGGRLMPYDIKQTQLFKANTGVIPSGMEVLPYELCRSMEIYLLEDDTFGDEITITDVEIKHENAPNTLADFAITYRRADSFTTKIKTPKPVKLFDSSFDGSFN